MMYGAIRVRLGGGGGGGIRNGLALPKAGYPICSKSTLDAWADGYTLELAAEVFALCFMSPLARLFCK